MSDPTESVPGGGQPPPQYGAPPPYQQPGYGPPSRTPQLTVGLVASIVIIAGYVTAGAGLLAALAFLTVDGADGAFKLHEFLMSVATGLGLGSIAVAAGHMLRLKA